MLIRPAGPSTRQGPSQCPRETIPKYRRSNSLKARRKKAMHDATQMRRQQNGNQPPARTLQYTPDLDPVCGGKH